MSEMDTVTEQPKKKGGWPKGVPRKAKATEVTAAPQPEPSQSAKAASQEQPPDYSLLQYDLGDVSAREAWSPRSGRPFARHEDYKVGISHLPNLLPGGTIVNRHNPTQQYQRAWLEEDGSRGTRDVALFMKQKRWAPATASDFIIRPEFDDAVSEDSNGRLVYADLNGKVAAVIMVRTKEDYVKDRKELLMHSDDIQRSAEEKMAAMQDNLRKQGMNVTADSSAVDD